MNQNRDPMMSCQIGIQDRVLKCFICPPKTAILPYVSPDTIMIQLCWGFESWRIIEAAYSAFPDPSAAFLNDEGRAPEADEINYDASSSVGILTKWSICVAEARNRSTNINGVFILVIFVVL